MTIGRIVYFVIIVAGLLFAQTLFAQKENPYLTLQYDSVVIYDYDWRTKGGESFSIIDEKGKLASSIKKTAKLPVKTSLKLSELLGRRKSYGRGTAACFEPHLGIVYYLSGQPVAHITICIECNILDSSLKISAQDQGKQGEGEEVYYAGRGMSKAFRKYLNTLLKRYDFSHQVKSGSMFD